MPSTVEFSAFTHNTRLLFRARIITKEKNTYGRKTNTLKRSTTTVTSCKFTAVSTAVCKEKR